MVGQLNRSPSGSSRSSLPFKFSLDEQSAKSQKLVAAWWMKVRSGLCDITTSTPVTKYVNLCLLCCAHSFLLFSRAIAKPSPWSHLHLVIRIKLNFRDKENKRAVNVCKNNNRQLYNDETTCFHLIEPIWAKPTGSRNNKLEAILRETPSSSSSIVEK